MINLSAKIMNKNSNNKKPDINKKNKEKAKERADKEANSWKAGQTSNDREDMVRTVRRRRRRR